MAQTVKNMSAMQETWVQSLGWKHPLEEDLETDSSFLVWRNPVDRGARRVSVPGVSEWDPSEGLNTHTHTQREKNNKTKKDGERILVMV